MLMKYFGMILRIVIVIFSLACLIWSCSFRNAGAVLGVIGFGLIIAVCIFWKPFCKLIKHLWKRLGGRIAVIFAGTVTAAGLVLCAVFSVNMILCMDKPAEPVKAVMVLGCQVRGEEPSLFLRGRTEAALRVLEENPEAVCVASGGKGNGENISEAECIKRILISHGITEDRIFTEDQSTSTRENFLFSKEIFDELGISDGIMIATNEFHQYRSGLYAKRLGLSVGHCSYYTPKWALLNYWIREMPAIVVSLIGDCD